MKPYDQINYKVMAKAALVVLGLGLIAFFLGRPIVACVQWMDGAGRWFGYSFCNPTLWFLGLDEMMWECPVKDAGHIRNEGKACGLFVLGLLSVIAHTAVAIGSVFGFIKLWTLVDKKK